MVEFVKKRDGRVIPFNEDRITRAIFLAATNVAEREGIVPDYKLSEQLTQEVIKFLNHKYSESVPSVEDIQDSVVKVLIETGHAKTSEEYIIYRTERSRIRNSKTRLMKAIEEITFEDAEDADIKRENANINGNTAMGTMLQYGSTVSKEFCKTHILKPEHSFAHDNGDIHIHDMDFLNMGTLTCCQIDVKKLFNGGFSTGHGFLREPQDIISYGALAAIAIQSNQNDQHGGQSIPFFDYGLAEGVYKTFKKFYIGNLAKALKLFKGIENNDVIKNIVYNTEKETNQKVGLKRDELYLNLEKEKLIQTFDIDDELVNKMQNFAFEESYRETDKKTYQSMEAFIHNLNTMHSRAGAQVPFSSVNFGTDTSEEGRMVTKNLLLSQERGLGNGETPIFPILIFKVKEGINLNPEDPNYDLFKLSCRVSAKRLFPNFSFLDAPFNAKYYKKGEPDTEATYMGCRTRVLSNVCGSETVSGRGNISFTTVNLPRLGIKHGIINNEKANLDGFFEELDEKINLIIEQLLERLEVQGNKKMKNFPFLMGQGVWKGSDNLGPEDTLKEVIKQGTLTIGFIGLAECLIALIGKHHGESKEAQELGLKIVSHMRHKMDEATDKYKLNFSLMGTPAEGLSGRFTKIDKKVYGEIKGITDKEYYTNSFHVPVYYNISAYDKIEIEAPYHELTNAGHITYVELDGDPSDNLEAFETVIKAMKDLGIGYGSINHPVDRDPICGFSGVITSNICPVCGRNEDESDIKFERIRRITGYLVGTVDRFNNAKKAEVRDRVKHR
ncbi:TPA: anaerobic ribonucleoside triphosphate reductase [Clostridioides difficile]|uniref:Anaerobic ribonucleoside triphosphate reductase n=1 Tax=Clostridioides difficile ATCC 9689 = DSM 1296 TaxID=1121308 RepID=A0AC59FUU6_CLODI|nr:MULTISPECIES: anaerobic ribonucleoside triphosphate reductase [Bacteria]AKP41125.1 anaerobic ribonucleoside triphosphate reductase [Clostridioides difficile ATCC 9689 = DSM 1296]ARC15185.1 anaerobic ribonucleoside triphosphate reductase [Clostridioides difficile]AVI14236.1 anaerobic ribonucleoside triphosphate reductase [Clostridioides difficile]AXU85085.1 anaerobic ribonucleoside triphosphate reductase [Clostridioides difficile]EGT3644173.1 anaerobic ribonucleoside triphosphate reductase [